MIVIVGPKDRSGRASARGRYVVTCDEHGVLGRQTTAPYAWDRVELHRDSDGCSTPAVRIERLGSGRHRVWTSRDGHHLVEERASEQTAVALARRSVEEGA